MCAPDAIADAACTCCAELVADTSPDLGLLDGLGRVVLRHRAAMVRVARAEGLAAQDALDCAQEAFSTFLGLPVAASLVDRPAECGRMLNTLVRNAARNKRRRHHLARPHDADETALAALEDAHPSPDRMLELAEEQLRLRGCVASLGERQQRVVTLRLLEEQPGEDVAELLGLSRNHVAVLLMRARQQLRACMLREPV